MTDLFGLSLQFDLNIVRVDGADDDLQPDCLRIASIGWDKLTPICPQSPRLGGALTGDSNWRLDEQSWRAARAVTQWSQRAQMNSAS